MAKRNVKNPRTSTRKDEATETKAEDKAVETPSTTDATKEAAKQEKQAQRAEQRAKARGEQFQASTRIAQYSNVSPRLKAYAKFFAEHADGQGKVVIASLPARNPHYAGSNKGDDRACVAGVHNHGFFEMASNGLSMTLTDKGRELLKEMEAQQ